MARRRRRNRRRQPAALARYWAAHRRGSRRMSNRRRRRRSYNRPRRSYARHSVRTIHYRRHRRRNAGGIFRGGWREWASLGGGAVGNFFLTRWVPETFLAQYNSGWQGYLVAAGVGVAGAYVLPELAGLAGGNRQKARTGAWLGLVLELGARAYEDMQTGAGLGYYSDSAYPVRQLVPGNASPVPRFPLQAPKVVAMPATAANAGKAATQAMAAAATAGKFSQGNSRFSSGGGY